MENTTTADPVGKAQTDVIKDKIDSVIEIWRTKYPSTSWWSRISGVWFIAVRFILKVIDYFVQVVEQTGLIGPDKKATVLKALSLVYDVIVTPLLPFVFKPFSGKIKHFVIYVVASLIIDFIVGKYNGGSWDVAKVEMV